MIFLGRKVFQTIQIAIFLCCIGEMVLFFAYLCMKL